MQGTVSCYKNFSLSCVSALKSFKFWSIMNIWVWSTQATKMIRAILCFSEIQWYDLISEKFMIQCLGQVKSATNTNYHYHPCAYLFPCLTVNFWGMRCACSVLHFCLLIHISWGSLMAQLQIKSKMPSYTSIQINKALFS